MSKVKIEGNASGTGTLTISAPNTNTDRSLTLPDGAGEILTDATGLTSSSALNATNLTSGTIPDARFPSALPAIDGSALTGLSAGGITEYDYWRLHTNRTEASTGENPFTGNLERPDEDLFEKIGTGVTNSSGKWTFPSTGYWRINAVMYYEPSTNFDKIEIRIMVSSNNGSSYSDGAIGAGHGHTGYKQSVRATHLVKITDTTNHVVQFVSVQSNSSSITYVGNTDESYTYFEFMKIADI